MVVPAAASAEGASHIRQAPPPPLTHPSLASPIAARSLPSLHEADDPFAGGDGDFGVAAAEKARKDAKAQSRAWKRGGLGLYATSRAASQHGQVVGTSPLPLRQRPKWNNSKYDPAIHLPLEPKRRSFADETSTTGFSKYKKRTTKDFPLRTPPQQRVYLNKHQSMPQLLDHLERTSTPHGRPHALGQPLDQAWHHGLRRRRLQHASLPDFGLRQLLLRHGARHSRLHFLKRRFL